jgi:hypothetical protein
MEGNSHLSQFQVLSLQYFLVFPFTSNYWWERQNADEIYGIMFHPYFLSTSANWLSEYWPEVQSP